jgi:hypothetical protein
VVNCTGESSPSGSCPWFKFFKNSFLARLGVAIVSSHYGWDEETGFETYLRDAEFCSKTAPEIVVKIGMFSILITKVLVFYLSYN